MQVFSKFYILAAYTLKYPRELRLFLSLEYHTIQVDFKAKYSRSIPSKSESVTLNYIIHDAGYFMM